MFDLKQACGKVYRITLDESYEIGDHTRKDKLWNYRIPGKYGHIGVWGKDTLSVYCDRPMVITRLRQIAGITPKQIGDREFQGTFAPELLDEVATVIRARKRRRIEMSEERKDELRARLAAARAKNPGSTPGAVAPNRSPGS